MKITFYGAAGEVTGSQHLLEFGQRRILLDCGLFQGHRAAARVKNEQFHCRPHDLDAVILSHAHIDHCGNLPGLYKAGFRGPIFCTSATAEIAAIMLMDSAHIQQEDVKYLHRHLAPGQPPVQPLYLEEHVRGVIKLFEPLDYREWHELGPDVKVRFAEAGHILGSAIVELEVLDGRDHKRVVFTGDLGRRGLPLLRDPELVAGGDVLITESTYGNRIHPAAEDLKVELGRLIQRTVAKGGKVIIPAFSLGRTQTVLYFFNQLFNEGQLPDIPVYVDSPLSRELTKVHRRHLDTLDFDVQQTRKHDLDPFSFPGLSFIGTADESKALNRRHEPMVIIAASGMCENGRVVHHLKNNLSDPKTLVVLIGFQAEHTLGRRLQERQPTVNIFDRRIPVHATIECLNGLSAHADMRDFQWWFEHLAQDGGVGQAFIVHGEAPGAQGVAEMLHNVSNEPAIIPTFGQSFTV